MFPSFYPKGKTTSPAEKVKSSFDYVYGDTTSIGTKRLEKPVCVSGAEREVLETIAQDLMAISNDPVTTGSLNFEELVATSIRRKITESFLDFAYVGLDDAERLAHTVAHEKLLKLSGQRSTDVHFMFLHVLTGSRRVYVPYFREADSYGFYLWAELTNFRHALSSPYDPKRRRVTMPRIYGSDTVDIVELKRDIGTLVGAQFASGRLERPADVIDLLLAQRGFISARHSERGLVIEHTSVPRALRLNAPVYSPHHDGPKLRGFLAKLKRISREDCEAEFERITRNRADRQWRRFGTSHAWWTLDANFDRLPSPKTTYEPPVFKSSIGQLWGRAIASDREFHSALHQLGSTCETLGDRIGSLAGIVGHCFEDAEPFGEGCGGTEDALAQICRATDGAIGGVEILRRAIVESRRVLAVPRSQADEGGKIRRVVHQFNDAVRRLGGYSAGLPESIADVIAFVAEVYRGQKKNPKKAAWFSDSDCLMLRDGIWQWLRWIDSVACVDLEEHLETQRALVAEKRNKRELNEFRPLAVLDGME